ncbi:hypothetical protein LRS37_11190 [Neobacillus sedimentimangrovi]|uniref:Uncharacterized protein n=1 Tax=Neobacillus sedimentimangrovi TaxID=2699460 RepID=A0ABS8QJI2_9BACI|nr:hypothetical protein [Neobacillus sedimentimangrovi]
MKIRQLAGFEPITAAALKIWLMKNNDNHSQSKTGLISLFIHEVDNQ